MTSEFFPGQESQLPVLFYKTPPLRIVMDFMFEKRSWPRSESSGAYKSMYKQR